MRTIGIDVSKATLDVALRNEEGTLAKEERIKNSATALRSLLRKWRKQGLCDTTTLVSQPTGHYSHGVVKTLLDPASPPGGTCHGHPTEHRHATGQERPGGCASHRRICAALRRQGAPVAAFLLGLHRTEDPAGPARALGEGAWQGPGASGQRTVHDRGRQATGESRTGAPAQSPGALDANREAIKAM
ncbi:MAG: transposase [Flavobacteriales bacterium]|nr:transposase [Flavobacteriales bacterium]